MLLDHNNAVNKNYMIINIISSSIIIIIIMITICLWFIMQNFTMPRKNARTPRKNATKHFGMALRHARNATSKRNAFLHGEALAASLWIEPETLTKSCADGTIRYLKRRTNRYD